MTAASSRRVSRRDAGCVLAADPTATRVRLWINGATPHEGVVVDRPAGLPKWMAVSDATFEAWWIEPGEAVESAVFTKHASDEDGPHPPDIAAEAERLRGELTGDDWRSYLRTLDATPDYLQSDWQRGLRAAMHAASPAPA